jgi:nitrogen fixation NifU-like protein
MNQLDELYQTLILDHNRSPRNFGPIATATGHAEGRNPLCGDSFEIWTTVENDVVVEVGFLGQGCAISKASASMMTTAIKGKTVAEARALFSRFHEVVTGRSGIDVDAKTAARKELGCLSAFAGVAAFPIRVKCATLAWHAMIKAIEGTDSNDLAKT